MATEAQVRANRRNAEKSTAPRTDEGKAVVSQNVVRHGLSARQDVIRSEDHAEFERHREEILDEVGPTGQIETILVERIVSLTWRLKRAQRLQNEALDYLLAKQTATLAVEVGTATSVGGMEMVESDPSTDPDLAVGQAVVEDYSEQRVLDRLLMCECRIERSLYKTIDEVRRLRVLRELDAPLKRPARTPLTPAPRGPEDVSSLKCPVSSGKSQVVSRSTSDFTLQTSHFALRTSQETPHGVTTNAQAAADRLCKTNPISPGPGERQLSWGKEVVRNLSPDGSCKTNPIPGTRDLALGCPLRRQAESGELADGVPQYGGTIGTRHLPRPPVLSTLKSSQTPPDAEARIDLQVAGGRL